MKVRKLLALAAVFVLPAVLAAQHQHGGKKLTVQGEVLDMACFVAHDGKGPDHAKCALRCLKEGQPMGLLAKDGTVYWLFGDHNDTSAYNKAKELGGQNVEISGEAADGKGVKAITVQGVKPI